MTEHANTMIVRTYGLYKLKVFVNKQKVNTIYFISMENIFQSVRREDGLEIMEVYDLKGSLYGRTGEDGKELKDVDWVDRKKKIRLPAEVAEIFREQIKVDSRFFKKNNINDYSLMVAFVKHSSTDPPSPQGSVFKSFKGGCLSKDPGYYYILSIIDILTVFETRKNFEYIFKSTFLSKDVSCIPPSDYCARFREFLLASVE
jgi:1-phosphatidylinositol-4-phosphate 5-kinase